MEKRPVWFLHAQKVGGTSVANTVLPVLEAAGFHVPTKRNYPTNHVVWGAAIPPEWRSRYRKGRFGELVFGAAHLPHQDWMIRCVRAFLLRDPVLRVWSLHTFYQQTKHGPSKLARETDLEGFVDAAPGVASNVMTKLLVGKQPGELECTEDDYRLAQLRLACFEIVEPIHRLRQFLRQLHPHLEAAAGQTLEPLEVLHTNRSAGPVKSRAQLTGDQIARIEAKNAWDMKLWTQYQ